MPTFGFQLSILGSRAKVPLIVHTAGSWFRVLGPCGHVQPL